MEPEEFGDVRKISILLALKLGTGVDFFYNRPFYDVLEFMKDTLEIIKETAEHGKKQ